MTGSHILSICAVALSFLLLPDFALAADRSVFGGKTLSQHELSVREKKKIKYEFQKLFSHQESAGYQKLGGNPWKAKKAKQQQVGNQAKLINTWGQCREYSYKKRGQCYARGSNAYTCERHYDARVSYCNDKF